MRERLELVNFRSFADTKSNHAWNNFQTVLFLRSVFFDSDCSTLSHSSLRCSYNYLENIVQVIINCIAVQFHAISCNGLFCGNCSITYCASQDILHAQKRVAILLQTQKQRLFRNYIILPARA